MLYMALLGLTLIGIGVVLIRSARTTSETDQLSKEPLVWER